MTAGDKVRFRTETVFEEADPPKDRSRSLEWRRSFKVLVLTARHPVVSHSYSVNDWKFRFVEKEVNDVTDPDIEPDLKRKLVITSRIDSDGCNERFLHAKEMEKGSGIYELSRLPDEIEIYVVSREASKGDSIFAPGSYTGIAFVNDVPGTREHLFFELSAPAEFLEEVSAQLRDNPDFNLEVRVALRCFSFEVDDALRGPYDSRDLFIYQTSPAALMHIATVQPRGESTPDGIADDRSREKPVHRRKLSINQSILASPLRSIGVALWVLVGILALRFFGSL